MITTDVLKDILGTFVTLRYCNTFCIFFDCSFPVIIYYKLNYTKAESCKHVLYIDMTNYYKNKCNISNLVKKALLIIPGQSIFTKVFTTFAFVKKKLG